MTQRRRLLSLCSFSFGTSVCLPLLLGSVLAAETATAPIHTHTLKPLIASAQSSSKPLISFKTQPDKTASASSAPSTASPSASSEEQQENMPAPPASEPVSLPPQPVPEPAQSLPAPEASSAPVRNPLDPSESNEDMKKAQSDSASPAPPSPAPLPVTAAAPAERALTPLPEEAKPVLEPVRPKTVRAKPAAKKAPKAKKKIKIHSPPPRQLSLHAPETREESENLDKIKQEMAVSHAYARPYNADQSELAGVRLGMNFAQARHAVAQTLQVGLEEVKIIGTPPEAQTCDEGTQLSASSRQGSINVQFACDARLPYAQELSVSHIAYEPDTGTIESILQKARQKYGDPVNLDQFDPRKADFVTYYWCANPERNPASASGKDLYCTVKAGNRLRLQGRDNSLEFQLLASLKKAYHPQTESLPYDFTSDEDSLQMAE